MARKCTCIRCRSEDFVRSVYPRLDDERIKAVGEKIMKQIRATSVFKTHTHIPTITQN